ncbi:MAG: crotonase/enoyl-CoA hydratase family protein [Pseudomonadota bacterium]
MFETLSLEHDDRGVATLTLARPEKHNALSGAMIDELSHAAALLGADDAVRVVVLTGQGQSFCAGGDLAWMQASARADAAGRRAEARRLADMLGALDALPKPLIGQINGPAYGGGVGLISVCDVAIGAVHAKLGLTETRLGLIPATIGPYVVARLGPGMARQVFMSGRIFGADEAVRLGLLARTALPEALAAAVAEEVAPYLACAPGAVADAKSLLRRLGGAPDPATIDATLDALVARWESDEAAEGIEAFFAKRPPSWKR